MPNNLSTFDRNVGRIDKCEHKCEYKTISCVLNCSPLLNFFTLLVNITDLYIAYCDACRGLRHNDVIGTSHRYRR